MIFITFTLNDNEWDRIRRIAQANWPNQTSDRQLSRSEACRRLLVALPPPNSTLPGSK